MHLDISTSHTDAVNARILAVSEDRIAGFVRNPMGEIARRCELPVETVIERIRAMLRGGTIRRVRQTLMATDLAPGALVAWEVDADKLDAAFETMFQQRPLFRPRRPALDRHAVDRRLAVQALDDAQGAARVFHGEGTPTTSATRLARSSYRLMPAKGIFALGVGHTRRQLDGARREVGRCRRGDACTVRQREA